MEKKLIAQELARMGRGGDTMLAHINPQEAAILKMMGGSGTINPDTGLPEFGLFKNFIRTIAPVAIIVVAVFAPELIPAIGSEILGTTGAAGVAEVAAGSAAISAGTTALAGGSPEDIAKNAAIAAITAGTGQAVSSSVSGALAEAGVPAAAAKVAGSTAAAAANAAATGRDISQAITTAALTTGATVGYQELTSTPPQLTTPTTPPTEAGATIETGSPVDYSLTAGMKFPGQGLQAPELAPLPEASTIGTAPIDYANLLTPTMPGMGYQPPRLKELPPAEKIGVEPIDYGNIFTPEMRNLPSMGGGTGLTAETGMGEPVQVAPPETSPLKQAGEAATRYAAGQLASSLYDQPTRSTSALSSTGLFTPTSIVPTALTGVAPIARGKPILGSEDEEAAGAWGSKTLRG